MAGEMNITQHLLILTDAEYDQLVIALRENFYINKKLEQAFDRYFGRKMNEPTGEKETGVPKTKNPPPPRPKFPEDRIG